MEKNIKTVLNNISRNSNLPCNLIPKVICPGFVLNRDIVSFYSPARIDLAGSTGCEIYGVFRLNVLHKACTNPQFGCEGT